MNIDIDYGNDDRTTLTWARGHHIILNDRVNIGSSNKYITRIIQIIDSKSVEIKTFIRPSKGFAKHNRRMKSNEY